MRHFENISPERDAVASQQPFLFRLLGVAHEQERDLTIADLDDHAGQIRIGQRRGPRGVRREQTQGNAVDRQRISWMGARPAHVFAARDVEADSIRVSRAWKTGVDEDPRPQRVEHARRATWPLNQATTLVPVSDVTNNGADEIATVGTVGVSTDPPGYDFNIAPPPAQAIQIYAGPPRTRWRTEQPAQRWTVGQPDPKWRVGSPHA